MNNPLQAVSNHRRNNVYNSQSNPQLDDEIESILIDLINNPMVGLIHTDDKKVLKNNKNRTLGIYERLVRDGTIKPHYIPKFKNLFSELWRTGGRRTRRKRAHHRTRHRK